MSDLARLWRTVRHLRPVQIVGRAHFLWHRPRVESGPPPPVTAVRGPWSHPARRAPSMTGPTRLHFLSDERELDACGWDDPQVDRLWRYNLHYFDDLNALGAEDRVSWHVALTRRWVAQNPPPSGSGWEPYPVSLRMVNWIKWWLSGQRAEPAWIHSLAVQARWLHRRLEWHLLGNHLFVNAKALVFAGLYFDGTEARAWLQTGLRILERELPEQILPDGGHFERSTMYHALALEDLLDLINVTACLADAGSPVRRLLPELQTQARAMLNWLRCMQHPDGGIALFNDAAADISPGNDELEAYASRLGVAAAPAPADGVTDLRDSGYVRVICGPAVAFLDLAPIGPDYLVGHAHADTLAFELSLGARRVIVNGGTSCYGLSTQRLYERGTAWHSTVQLDDQNSSEVWSGFRVGRRARVVDRMIRDTSVVGAHDGWRYLRGSPVHRRCWSFARDALVVEDVVERIGRHAALARFHLAPGLRLTPTGRAGGWWVMDGGTRLAEVLVEAGLGSVAASQHAPRFGVLLPTQSLVVALVGGQARTRWRWISDAYPLPQ